MVRYVHSDVKLFICSGLFYAFKNSSLQSRQRLSVPREALIVIHHLTWLVSGISLTHISKANKVWHLTPFTQRKATVRILFVRSLTAYKAAAMLHLLVHVMCFNAVKLPEKKLIDFFTMGSRGHGIILQGMGTSHQFSPSSALCAWLMALCWRHRGSSRRQGLREQCILSDMSSAHILHRTVRCNQLPPLRQITDVITGVYLDFSSNQQRCKHGTHMWTLILATSLVHNWPMNCSFVSIDVEHKKGRLRQCGVVYPCTKSQYIEHMNGLNYVLVEFYSACFF